MAERMQVAPVEVEPQVTEYVLCMLPEDHELAPHLQIRVQYRSRGLWAVKDMFRSYDRDGTEEYESLPSSRTDEYLARYRFPLHEALAIAQRVLPTLTCNGWYVDTSTRQVAMTPRLAAMRAAQERERERESI